MGVPAPAQPRVGGRVIQPRRFLEGMDVGGSQLR